MQKFLVIQTAFIGDVVLATALLEKLHHHFPEAEIDILVRRGNESLLTGHPFLHEVLVWDKKEGKYRSLWRLIRQIRKHKYDKVINIQRFAATGFLTALSGGTEKIGFDKNPFSMFFDKKIKHIIGEGSSSPHEVERNLSLVSDFTSDTLTKPRLYPTANDEQAIANWKERKYITASPASVWFTKQYPKEKWLSFIDLVPADYTIYLLGGPGDKDLAEEIIRDTKHKNVINLCGSLSFLQSAALMKDATMNYVNDSAPMHFASAVNAPVTAIYCSTLPSFGFGPLSDIRFIVERQGTLYCRPCGLHGKKACPEGHFRCAVEIKEEQLLNKLSQGDLGIADNPHNP